MSEQSAATTVAVSVAAVERYISLAPKNRDRHLANILIHANGKDLTPSVRFISTKACKDTAEVIIEGFHSIYADRSNDVFTIQDSEFFFCGQSKSLHVKTQNMSGIQISITITKI